MKYEFLLLYDSLTSFDSPGYTDKEIGVLLTKAQESLLLETFDPFNSVEETEKNRAYFSELIRDSIDINGTLTTYVSSSQYGVHPNGKFFGLPSDYLFSLSGEVVTDITCDSQSLSYKSVTTETKAATSQSTSRGEVLKFTGKIIPVKPVSHDEYTVNIKNPFKKPTTDRVWRLEFYKYGDRRHELITDGTYNITAYILRYLKKPVDITPFGDGTTTAQSNCELNEVVHKRIVEKAVRMASAVTKLNEYKVKLSEEKINE